MNYLKKSKADTIKGQLTRCSLTALLAVFLFVTLLFISNLGSADQMRARFANSEPSALRFTECEVGLSIIIRQDRDLLSSLLPRTYPFDIGRPCDDLLRVVEESAVDQSKRLRPRYWWGFKAVYALMLSKLTTTEAATAMTWFSHGCYLLLGLSLFRLSKFTFLVMSPFILMPPFLSGIHFHSEPPIALGYIWAVLASAIYANLLKSKTMENWLYPFILFTGMVTAFLWFMGGELLLLAPLLILITFLYRLGHQSLTTRFLNTIKVVSLLHIGFVLSMLIGYAIKASVYGLEPVIASFTEAANHRLSLQAKGANISFLGVLKQLSFRGFQHTAVYDNVLMWKTLLVSAGITGLLGFMYLAVKTIRQFKQYGLVLMIFASVLGYFLLRVLIVPNHSYIHSWMIGRYVIVPICLCWSTLIYAAVDIKKGFLK